MTRLFRTWLMLLLVSLGLPSALASPSIESRGVGSHDIMLAELPVEARDTLMAIKQGGPFAYPRDGVIFGNYERILPYRPRGYYHEYTVKTPMVRTRGKRRIVCGPLPECYFTADHYQTFKRIRE